MPPEILLIKGDWLADYTGIFIDEKTKETINGRVVLQDTNNSANDFVTFRQPKRICAININQILISYIGNYGAG
jgi:hypothetical protein